ncbi:Asp-tRNA(Asn)/Glu-tRNA(Gln) amidotransferase subunit GatA [Lapidilactobacillus salsurivasis]
MSNSDYLSYDLQTLHQLLVDKKVTAVALTEEALAKINAQQPALNAFITINQKKALARAAELDAKGIDPDDLLAGIPIAYKDNIVTNGIRTTAASHILDNFNPVYDATVVEKLDAAGTINLGKTNMDEFAMGSSTETSHFGVTHNPWDLDRVPGGSSGGSAAAVAAGEVFAALGSDTGGSIRQPAAYNGIFGIKPTYGRVSRWGLIAFGSSFDQIGVFTRRAQDAAVLLGAISGHDPKDSTSSEQAVPDFTAAIGQGIKGLKIAVPDEFFGEGIAEDVKAQVEKGLQQLADQGAIIDHVQLPHTKYAVPAYYVLASSEASSNLQRFDGIRYGFRAADVKNLDDVYVRSRSEGFGPEVKRRIMLGTFALSSGYYDAYFTKAAAVRTLIKQDFEKILATHDLIIGPTAPDTAFKIGVNDDDPITLYMKDILTISANMAGVPAASVPAGFNAEGLPVGMQMIAKRFDESTIFRAAAAFEELNHYNLETPTFKNGGNA